jgi:hypothetical protein
VADSVNRIVMPPVSLERAVAVDRERDRGRERERDEKKRKAIPPVEKIEDEAAIEPVERQDKEDESTDPQRGKSLDIKI